MALPESPGPPPRRRRGRKAWARPSVRRGGGEGGGWRRDSSLRRHRPCQGKGTDGNCTFSVSSQGSRPSSGGGRSSSRARPLSRPRPTPALVQPGAVTAFQGRGGGGNAASALVRQRREFPARRARGGGWGGAGLGGALSPRPTPPRSRSTPPREPRVPPAFRGRTQRSLPTAFPGTALQLEWRLPHKASQPSAVPEF